MASVTIGGLSSGLPANLVDQLVDAERLPIRNLENRRAKAENKLGLVQEMETKINAIKETIGDLATQKGFSDIKLETGDPNIIQGTVDAALAPKGNWNIEVIKLAEKSSVLTNGFPDKDKTEIGIGYFKFDTSDGEKEVYINGKNNTLSGAAQAINNANIGMRAAVISDRADPDNSYRIMITSETVGGDNKIEYPTLYFLDGDQDLYFDKENEAKNGRVKVDGFEFEINENSLNDIIPGVTLNLKQSAPGKSIGVTVSEDQSEVSTKVGGFVAAINEVLGFIQTQNRVDQNTDTSMTLGGDSLLRSVENRLRRLIQNPQYGISGSITRLNQIGIQFNRNGTLDLDEDKFNSVLGSNSEDVKNFFAGDGFETGFITSLKRDLATTTNQAFGPVAMRKKSLQQNIRRLDQNITNKERHLEKREQQLRNKFAKLEQTMSGLNQQGSALAALGGGGQGLNLSGAQISR